MFSLQAKHQVHVLNGLSRGPFQQVVNAHRDEQFVGMAFGMNQAFVRVDYLFQVDGTSHIVRKRSLAVKFTKGSLHFFERCGAAGDNGGKYASGKVGPIGQKVYFAGKCG